MKQSQFLIKLILFNSLTDNTLQVGALLNASQNRMVDGGATFFEDSDPASRVSGGGFQHSQELPLVRTWNEHEQVTSTPPGRSIFRARRLSSL